MIVRGRMSGFTLIELLVVIAIIAILAAILFPVFAQAREKARQITCVSNEKQMGLAILQYVQDYDEYLPMSETMDGGGTARDWQLTVQPYVKNGNNVDADSGVQGGMWQCPSFPTVQQDNYGIHDELCPAWWDLPGAGGFNISVHSLASVQTPASLIMVLEKGQAYNANMAGSGFYTSEDGWEANGAFDNSGTCANPTTTDSGSATTFDWDDPIGTAPTAQDITAAGALEGSGAESWIGPGISPRFRHQGMCTSLFVDGHVKPMRKGQMSWCQYIYSPGITPVS